eukprot:SAG22_NODE_831_length_6940_cov_12.139599_2_plen_135_part_00
MHTTYPWTGDGQRKSVFYKYSARDAAVPTLAMHGCISVDEQPGRNPKLLRNPAVREPQDPEAAVAGAAAASEKGDGGAGMVVTVFVGTRGSSVHYLRLDTTTGRLQRCPELELTNLHSPSALTLCDRRKRLWVA